MQASANALTATAEKPQPFEQRIVASPPAQALVDAAGDNPQNPIVVGNRGLGAADGQLLGSLPGEVVANAMCNVLIVQTTRHAGDLQAMARAMERQHDD